MNLSIDVRHTIVLMREIAEIHSNFAIQFLIQIVMIALFSMVPVHFSL